MPATTLTPGVIPFLTEQVHAFTDAKAICGAGPIYRRLPGCFNPSAADACPDCGEAARTGRLT